MSLRMLWLCGVSVFMVIVGLTLSGFAHAATGVDIAKAALDRTKHQVTYDPAYVAMAYPGGDVDPGKGVCTDVIIRSYRSLGIDLQQLIHEDMTAQFSSYPAHWGLTKPDPNIDHRRVPNLQTFFRRHGESLTVSQNPANYLPGDLVTWTVPPHLPHIGIVAQARSEDGARPLIIHNIGQGPKQEDRLFDFPITGHYRYTGPKDAES